MSPVANAGKGALLSWHKDDISTLVLPREACRWAGQAACNTRLRSNRKPARAYIARLISLTRFTCTSTGIVVQGVSSAACTAWAGDYNAERPHSTPRVFKLAWQRSPQANSLSTLWALADRSLAQPQVLADRPLRQVVPHLNRRTHRSCASTLSNPASRPPAPRQRTNTAVG